MKALHRVFIVIFIFSAIQLVKAQEVFVNPKTMGTISEMMNKYEKLNLFSGIVNLYKDGKEVFSKSMGYADADRQILNSPEVTYRLASISKLFTITGILLLYDAGRLDVDDNIGKYLDGFSPDIAGKVTIRNLIQMRGGFGDYLVDPEYRKNRSNFVKIDSLMRLVKKEKLKFVPGTDVAYSNSGFVILGAIIEKISGKDYYDYVREFIFVPLGMNNTYFFDTPAGKNEALRYKFNLKGELVKIKTIYPPSPAGNAASTAEDLFKFTMNICGPNSLISDKSKKVIYIETTPEFINENGKPVRLNKKVSAFGWTGGLPGISTILGNYIDYGITMIIFANITDISMEIADNIGSILLGGIYSEPKLPPECIIYKSYFEHGIDYIKNNFSKIAGSSSASSNILINIGYDLAGENKLQDAINIFTIAADLFPQNPNTWDSLAETYLKMGNKNEAVKYYRRALQADPAFASSLKALKDLEK